MKKNYQIPEVEILNLDYKHIMNQPSDGEIGDIDSNKGISFDEDEISTETSKSLWED